MPKELLLPTVKENPEPIIDTDSLTYFLLGAGFLWRSGQKFAKYLDLRVYTSRLQEFRKESNIVDVLSDEQKDQFLAYDFGDTTGNTPFAKARRELRESVTNYANHQAEGEASLGFYYDLSDYQIKSVESEPGEYANTPAAIFQILKMDNCIPLIEAHKHPDDSFFSPQDFHPLLTALGDTGSSLSRAILLVCPNIQVLALATMQTPLLSQEDTINLFQPVNDNLMADKEAEEKEILERLRKLIEQRAKYPVYAIKKCLAEEASVEANMKKQNATQEEINFVIKQLADKYKRRGKHYFDKKDQVIDEANRQLMALIHRTASGNFINFARSINVVLYNSYNFRDFCQFSA